MNKGLLAVNAVLVVAVIGLYALQFSGDKKEVVKLEDIKTDTLLITKPAPECYRGERTERTFGY